MQEIILEKFETEKHRRDYNVDDVRTVIFKYFSGPHTNNKFYYFDQNYLLQIKTTNNAEEFEEFCKKNNLIKGCIFNSAWIYVRPPSHLYGQRICMLILRDIIFFTDCGRHFLSIVEEYNDYMVKCNGKSEQFVELQRQRRLKGLTEIEKFVLKINAPKVEREIGNTNTKTFDFVRIRMSIPTQAKQPDRTEYVSANLSEIVELAIKKMESSNSYTRYGVPTNFLVLRNATITFQSELELFFELKI